MLFFLPFPQTPHTVLNLIHCIPSLYRVFADLSQSGFFPDMLEQQVQTAFLPWLYDRAASLYTNQTVARETADDLVRHALSVGRQRHRERKCYIRVVVNVGAFFHFDFVLFVFFCLPLWLSPYIIVHSFREVGRLLNSISAAS